MGIIKRFKEWREKRNEKWHIISNHHELPIGKYLRISEIGKREGDSEIDKSTAVLEVLTGWSAEDIECLSLTEYSALASGCGWLYEEIAPVEIEKEYRVGDYVLRPTNAENLTAAQFIEFQQYAKEPDKYIVELLSVLLVPIGKKYGDGYDVGAVRKWIARYLPTDTAISLVGFFLANAELSTKNMLHSLEKDIQEAPAKKVEQIKSKAMALAWVKHLLTSGDGCSTSK